VCFTPAGESLINSGLVLYLTDSKNVKGGKKRGGEGDGCSDKEPYVLYLGMYGLGTWGRRAGKEGTRKRKGRFTELARPSPALCALREKPSRAGSRAAFVISLEPKENLIGCLDSRLEMINVNPREAFAKVKRRFIP